MCIEPDQTIGIGIEYSDFDMWQMSFDVLTD